MNPLTSIPALYRQRLYVGYGVAALIVGAISAYFLVTPDTTLPLWLSGAQRVLGFLALPFGVLAGANVGPEDRPKPAPKADDVTPARDEMGYGMLEFLVAVVVVVILVVLLLRLV